MEVTLDALEAELAELVAIQSRTTARLLALLAAADAMQAPFIDGARTMAEWTARTLDCEVGTAKRLVRTARGIPEGVFERLASGALTADRAHAYTEASLAGIDVGLLDGLELAGVWHLCRRRREEPVRSGGYLVVQPQLDEAGYQVYGRLGAVQGSVVTQALEAEADRLCDGVPATERPTRSELRADALTSLCEGGDRQQAVVTVHHNAEGSVEVDGVAATRGDLDHATCVGAVEHDVAGRPVGPTRQSVSPRQRRRILYRDQHRCTVEGCTSRHRLEVHHIHHRARGGDHADARRGAPGSRTAEPFSENLKNVSAVLQPTEGRRPPCAGSTITWSSTAGASPSTRPAQRAAGGSSPQATPGAHPTDLAPPPPDTNYPNPNPRHPPAPRRVTPAPCAHPSRIRVESAGAPWPSTPPSSSSTSC